MTTRIVLRSHGIGRDLEAGGLSQALSAMLREKAMRRPGFSGCWTTPDLPLNHRVLESYMVLGTTVKVVSQEQGGELLYHVRPWEYDLPDPWITALARVVQKISYLPPPTLISSAAELRDHVHSSSSRLLRSMVSGGQLELGRGIEEREDNISRLSEIVVRYTVGLGLFEVLLSDDRIEDVFVDAPSSENPLHITINGVNGTNAVRRCLTNITASSREVEKIASRLKQTSGHPFSEAFPVLETDVEGFESRATVIGPPLSPGGTALALRRHSRRPWTLMKLAYNGSIDVSMAGLLSFLIDGRSAMLVCGARGAGKSSLLSAMMFEFPLSQRILTIEDTLELPTPQMQALGYKVQSLFVESSLEHTNEEMADQALRVSLRLGESAIVLGEVRGKEAQTLYQSMRTGKAGSSVLGTMHGESASSVYERVVHDMGIPKEAFMATDLVLTMGLSRPGGSSRSVRRLVEISECHRNNDAAEFHNLLEEEGAFTGSALNASSVVRRIASSWDMSMDEALSNIQARTDMRQVLLDSAASGGLQYLEPEWVLRCNRFFWDRIDSGDRDYGRMVDEFRSLVNRRS